MSPEETNQNSKICPTCGTRLSENATRCLVCGRTFTPAAAPQEPKGKKKKSTDPNTVQAPHLPELTLSLPVAIGIVLLLLVIGAAIVFAVFQAGLVSQPSDATVTPTATITPTASLTPTATATGTPEPTATERPPYQITVQANDTCLIIAARTGVSSDSIITLNNLSQACNTLSEGQTLMIPYPTATPTEAATSTLSSAEATDSACTMYPYTVVSGDTLGNIAANYNVAAQSIRDYNGMTSDIVFEGMTLNIPLCERLPTEGPTPTPTYPPPYLAPNLLLPADGAVFTAANDTVTLQWSAIGTLLQNEAYAVTIEDVTDGTGKILTAYVTDTKYIVPVSFRPVDTSPHLLRWSVSTVRQTGTANDGTPIYDSAGATSTSRAFVWWSSSAAPVTPTSEMTVTPTP